MAIRPSTISRFRASTRFMSVAVEPVTMPKRSAWRTRSTTFALQISFLLGRQLVFGQEPPINLRSTTAVRCPDLAMCQARYLPPSPLPRTSISKCSGRDIFNSSSFGSERYADEHLDPREQVVRSRAIRMARWSDNPGVARAGVRALERQRERAKIESEMDRLAQESEQDRTQYERERIRLDTDVKR